jgi:hypothetical protein
MFRSFRPFCANAIHGLSIVSGVSYPPVFAATAIHIMNPIIRIILFCMGVATFWVYGAPISPGLVLINDYRSNNNNDHYVSHPVPRGTRFPSILWCVIVLSLSIADIVRCVLVLSHRWHAIHNRLDMGWFGTTGMAIPLLIGLVAVQLGTEEIFTVTLLVVLTGIASICELSAEELCTMTKSETQPDNDEIRRVVVCTLRCLHTITLFSVLLIGGFQFLLEMVYHEDQTSLVAKSVLMVLFASLIIILTTTQFCNDILCIRLAGTRRDRCSMLPSSTNKTNCMSQQPRVPPIRYESENEHGINSTDDFDPFNVEASEKMFDALYGCHIHVKKGPVQKVGPGSLLSRIIQNGPQIDTDGDGNGTRKKVGLLIEWRRYYIVNMIINALLVVSLLCMTDLLDTW